MITRIKCLIRGHEWHLIKILNSANRKIGCKRCKREFIMNDDLHCILPWDADFDAVEKEVEAMREMIICQR